MGGNTILRREHITHLEEDKVTLLFSTEAHRQFDPIAKQFDLVCTVSSERNLRYENNEVFLLINYDDSWSYELGIEIGKTGIRCPPFSLSEILRLRGVQDAAFVARLMISDKTQLPNILSRLAKLTHDNASDFLKGDVVSFAKLEIFRHKECFEFELASRLRHMRMVVDAAWLVRDYRTIVRSFEPLEAYLSEAEKKKLEYSRGHL